MFIIWQGMGNEIMIDWMKEKYSLSPEFVSCAKILHVQNYIKQLTNYFFAYLGRYQPFSHFWIISDFYASIRNWLQKEILFRLKVYNIYLHICQSSNKNLWNYFIDMLSTYYTVDTSTSYQISMLWCCR